MSEINPTTIRVELERQRARGVQFHQAWNVAAGYPGRDTDERHLLVFMRKHFEAAYNNTERPEGRYSVPERDVSAAIGRGRQLTPAGELAILDWPPLIDRPCRSGDGCGHKATHGTFGRMWCEYHYGELSRLREKVTSAREKADPRRGGNKSLFTHEAAA
jgi:hypothetical protein